MEIKPVRSRLHSKATTVSILSIIAVGSLGYVLPESFASTSSSFSSDLGASARWNICAMDTCDSVSVFASKSVSGIIHVRIDTISDLGRVPSAFGDLTITDSSVFMASEDLKSASLKPVQVDVCTNFDESNNVCLSHDTWTIAAEWTATNEAPFLDKNNNQTLQPAVAIGTFNGDDLGQSNQAFIINLNTATGGSEGGGDTTSLTDLINNLKSMNLSHHVQTSLMKPLTHAEKILKDSSTANDKDACGILDSFLSKVNSYEKHDKLTPDQASDLAQMAMQIETNLGCGS